MIKIDAYQKDALCRFIVYFLSDKEKSGKAIPKKRQIFQFRKFTIAHMISILQTNLNILKKKKLARFIL